MTNVKVHLKEITKYVLLLGLGIQIVLGVICCLKWIGSEDAAGACKSVGGVFLCGCMAYLFLRSKYVGWAKRELVVGTVGIVASPMVLQAGLDIESESLQTFVLVAVFIAFFLLYEKVHKKWLQILGLMVLIFVAILSCNMGHNTSFAAKMASRCCYPQVLSGIYIIPEEVLDGTGYLELREALQTSDGIEMILYPQLLERHGSVTEADRVCYRLAKYGLANYTKSVAGSVIWDYVSYHVPQVVAELQLQGYGGDAITGYRYDRLTNRTGHMGAIYWLYGVVWYVLASVIMLASGLLERGKPTKREVILLFFLELVVLCLVMQGAGLFDYTKLLIVPFLWMGMVLKTAGVGCGDN